MKFRYLFSLILLMFTFVFIGCNTNDNDPKESIKDLYDCISIEEAIQIALNSGEVDTVEKYYIYGTILTVSNPIYGEMVITDGNLNLYVYGVVNENDQFYDKMVDKPVAGDEVVLYGSLKTYNGQPELGRSVLKAFNHLKPEINEEEYKKMNINAARLVDKKTKVKLTGIVAQITYAFGLKPNGFYLIDDTGSIYVYGGDIAQQVKIGNKITIVGEKNYYINPDEASNAEKYGYTGSCQIQNIFLIDNDKKINSYNKNWIKKASVKEIISTPLTNNITSDIFKVVAIIKKVPGSGFVNYYINDLDNQTGSYVYTACNGNDFEWLDKFDGKICTIYLSAINCKSTTSGCLYRFIPIEVEEVTNFSLSNKRICELAIELFVIDQFVSKYSGNPQIELITNASFNILNINNINISYSSNDNNVISFDKIEDKLIFNVNNSGICTITLSASYGNEIVSCESEIIVENNTQPTDYITVKEAIESDDNSKVKIQGIVISSLVNQTGFYIGDETGIIAVTCSSETIKEVKLGDLIILEGTRIHKKKNSTGAYAGQSVIIDAIVIYNSYGNNEYCKDYFIYDKTLKDIYELDYTQDFTTNVYVVKAKINFIENNYYTSIELLSEDGQSKLGLYCSSAKQYNWLKEFNGKVVTLEIVPCNWNDKNYYRGCVISVTDGEKIIVNNLNFQN